MRWDKDREKELAKLLDDFSLFIMAHIRKFRVTQFGVDPEDIAQEVRIKLWKILRDEKKIISYPSYIKKVVDSSVIDYLRKRRREDNIVQQEKVRTIAEGSYFYPAEAESGAADARTALGAALGRLIESRRAVVQLYLMNFSIEEISKHFQWSLHKTRNLLYRGLADLRKTFKEHV